MKKFIQLILALGFKQLQNVGDSMRYILCIKRNNIEIAYISVFVDEEGRFAGHTDKDTEVYQWELQMWQTNPRQQIMYLPDHFEFSIDTRGRFEESDRFKKTVEQSVKFIQDIDRHIKNIQNEIQTLISKRHFMPDPDSDEYQDNLEISWEVSDLRDDLYLLKSLKPKEVVWVYRHSYEHGDDDGIDNDGIIDEKEFKFISYGMKHLSTEYNKFLRENEWIQGSATEQLNEDYIMLTVATAPYTDHVFTLTRVTR